VRLLARASLQRHIIHVTDKEARAIPESELPVYTVLVPAYHEAKTLPQLLGALDKLEYPKAKLEVMLLLESDDFDTIAAARAHVPTYVEVVLVPPSEPRTKPKALNYGLLAARGELVTIYDVEDIPEPLQLRRVVSAFRDVDPRVACIQARLGFYNSRQNQITRWFTLDYAIWFDWFLPGLVADADVVPLSGTSNHFRRDALIDAGAWDPFNVTEDADLGVRLRRLRYGIALIESNTGEEATSDFVNWLKQRSRWYKGYLQTWFVHMRRPRQAWRDLGPRGFASFNFFVGGTPVLAVCNVVTWALTIAWILAQPAWLHAVFPPIIYYPSLFCFVVGNFICIYMGMMSARETGNSDLMLSALMMPIYWLMMSLAALKAVVQLFSAPSFWEKTAHGMATSNDSLDPTTKDARV
jgi:cellulose synthase/poly-beta-1,6-N-acetylglucosamine synthase-like glycosyltransferase